MDRTYEEPKPIDRPTAEAILAGDDTIAASRTLVSLALHEPDHRWVESICVRFLASNQLELVTISCTCLGHLARLHGRLDLERIVPLLRDLQATKSPAAGFATQALEDIATFMGEE